MNARYVIYDAEEDLLNQIFTDIHEEENRMVDSPKTIKTILQKLEHKRKELFIHLRRPEKRKLGQPCKSCKICSWSEDEIELLRLLNSTEGNDDALRELYLLSEWVVLEKLHLHQLCIMDIKFRNNQIKYFK
ncbi:hypothetical protein QQ045_000058 [Rhodiola kirilowii]